MNHQQKARPIIKKRRKSVRPFIANAAAQRFAQKYGGQKQSDPRAAMGNVLNELKRNSILADQER